MLNIFSGLVAAVIVSLFIGGLAQSIWQNTGSIAFPVIVASVLVMVYVDFWQNFREANKRAK